MLRRSVRIAALRHHIRTPNIGLRTDLRRFQSNEPIRDPSSAPLANQHLFMTSAAFVADFWKRFFLISALGLAASGMIVGAGLEGVHLWIEYKELAPETDEECRKWEWDLDMERWTGGAKGGTDSGLGFKGYHLLRSAWGTQSWYTGTPDEPSANPSSTSLITIEPRLELTQNFLAQAYKIALERAAEGRVRSETPDEILLRLADVMERIGTRDALFEARSELEEVWQRVTRKDHIASRLALKLGGISRRLGDADEALAWWARSLDLVSGGSGDVSSRVPAIPTSIPASPFAQRTLASALVSLSAFYATTGQLRQARQFEASALDALRSIPTPSSFASATPPQALHALYLLHRSALLSVHLAEVSHGLRSPAATSIEWLTRAAESSERVARVLTGVQRLSGPKDDLPLPSEKPLLPAFDASPSMKRPARSLLRDARRTAAESWHLMGILHERNNAPSARTDALACYERALAWAGVHPDNTMGEEGGLEAEWRALWANYTRVREMAKPKAANT